MMAGNIFMHRGQLRISMAFVAALGLAACDEDGKFAFPTAGGPDADGTTAATAPAARKVEQDVEKPDIFEVNAAGLWDGRPSLGGIWVAHPNVVDPERVIIRNTTNGKSVIGALFRRERDNPGPALQVSSDAAVALGMLAGAPTDLSVIALRREEVLIEPELPIEEEADAAVTELDVPAAISATPLDPIAGASAAIDAAEAATATPVEVSASGLTDAYIQLGIFSVERNANQAAEKLNGSGIESSVIEQQSGGRTVWRVVAGPAATAADRDEALANVKKLGFPDAFLVAS